MVKTAALKDSRPARKRAVADPAVALADALFTTTQQRVLALIFGQPNRSFYASELIKRTGSGAVQRELRRLSSSGLVTIRPIGNQKHYQANPESPVYGAYAANNYTLPKQIHRLGAFEAGCLRCG